MTFEAPALGIAVFLAGFAAVVVVELRKLRRGLDYVEKKSLKSSGT